MFKLSKEGEPGWTAPSAEEKLRRHVRYALGLNPFIGAAQTEAYMSVQAFMMSMGTFDQLMADTMEFLRRQAK